MGGVKPVRLQLSRRKGFDLQAWSREANGLPAVNVARPSKWGNPWRVGGDMSARECVEQYRHGLTIKIGAPLMGTRLRSELADLAGKNLACWCALDACCHADVLLELANVDNRRPP